MYTPGEILFGKYRIEACLGSGAFGEVYQATHLQLNTLRAIKILRSTLPGVNQEAFENAWQRFQFEASLGSRLNTPLPHPNLVQVHDFIQEAGAVALVMEYCPGGSLADRLETARQQGEQMPIEDCVRIALDIANGLAAIHQHGLVHRDLKPANILFAANGQAKIADLGLAQADGGPSQRSRLSQAQPHPGTPGYMSPEQTTQSGYLKPNSDIFSLGAVIFEMLTGRVYTRQKPGVRSRSLRPETPQWLDDLIWRMVSENPAGRPWDGREAAAGLQNRQAAETPSAGLPLPAAAPHDKDNETQPEEYADMRTPDNTDKILIIVFSMVVIIAIVALVILGSQAF